MQMQELDDNSLLREYVEHDSQEAFAVLVARHVNKVYSAALRQTRNPHQAQEITQAVFVILAKKSARFGEKVILSGWLYQTARLTARTFIRGEIRRTRREQEAHLQTMPNDTESDVWPEMAPLLDSAMGALNEKDRHAIVLRFFDGKSMKEIGMAMGASEDAAKMRLSRAVDRLRVFFSKRGITVPSAVLTATISANSVQAAPIGLAKATFAVAITKGATATASTSTLIKGALKVMAWSQAKPIIVAGIVALFATGTIVVLGKNAAPHPIVANAQSDSAALQGIWIGNEKNGPDGSNTLTIRGSTLEFHGANPNEWYKATFTLREDTTPKQLIAVITACPAPQYVGKKGYSIYQIRDGIFTLSGNEPGKPAPPKSFDAPGGRKFVFTKK